MTAFCPSMRAVQATARPWLPSVAAQKVKAPSFSRALASRKPAGVKGSLKRSCQRRCRKRYMA